MLYTINLFPFLPKLGLCFTEADFKKILKEYRLDAPSGLFTPGFSGVTAPIFNKEGTLSAIIIGLNKDAMKPHTLLEVQGLLVHEVSHVWDFLLEFINEKNPSSEFQAYGIQGLYIFFSNLLYKRFKIKDIKPFRVKR